LPCVEAVGANVTRFQPGDEVFGVCAWPSGGAVAEYSRAAEEHLVAKPANLSFEEAAAIPTSALAALHGLRDAGRLAPGERVLINGASGGVGTFAVQIAKAMGAEVTAVCSTSNVEMVRSLGADHVVDYTRDDFAAGEERYDLILDNVENRPLVEVRKALTPDGTLVLNSGTGASGMKMLMRLVRPIILSPLVRQRLRRYLSNPSGADLSGLLCMIGDKDLRPVIDRTSRQGRDHDLTRQASRSPVASDSSPIASDAAPT
jgi:NADPH:quinone reductase-like Zn-dependent oxidoreductase